jgi:DNA modification methylase
MGKVDIKRTELVWKGKYDDEGKLILVEKPGPYPFQIVEVVNSPRIGQSDNAVQSSLFETWKGNEGTTFEEGWKNKLIWGDNKFVMSSLLEKFAGKIDLIYIDPPFATGADFKTNVEIGDNKVIKEHSLLEEKAYRDTWGDGLDSFLPWIYERLQIMKELLSQKGSIYIHLDWHAGQYVKPIIDEIFGYNYFRNEIIWHYRTGNLAKNQFQRKHDNIFFYSKSNDLTFNVQEQKEYYADIYGPDFKPSFEGRKQGKDDKGIFRMATVDSVWDISAVFTLSKEHLPYDTQKPEALIERIIRASSNEGDLVADFFCGSGTTLAVAEKLNRRWIGVDLGRFAIHTTRKRLLDIEFSKSLENENRSFEQKAKPFEILNLGKYERQFWQVKAFNRKDEKQALYEYLAFILKLYGAEPIAGSQFIHGKKGSSLIYIGAVDSPVTIQEVQDALKDTRGMGMKELHILGWEWEMGLNDAIQEVAKQMGIRLKLRIIPMDVLNEQAINKKDIKFFELAYFKADLKVANKKLTVTLQDFVIPHTDLIPEDVQKSITKWSDWIDYWAVDFDFQNDTFNNTWTSYRTKQNRKLVLVSEKKYDQPGKYKVFVKIIDIFGIDTSQVFEISVK